MSVKTICSLDASHFLRVEVTALEVLYGEGKYTGVVARRWPIWSRFDPSRMKVKTIMRSAPTVKLDTPLSEGAKMRIESGVMHLPGYNREEVVGFVTEKAIIHWMVAGQWGNTAVEEIMTKGP